MTSIRKMRVAALTAVAGMTITCATALAETQSPMAAPGQIPVSIQCLDQCLDAKGRVAPGPCRKAGDLLSVPCSADHVVLTRAA